MPVRALLMATLVCGITCFTSASLRASAPAADGPSDLLDWLFGSRKPTQTQLTEPQGNRPSAPTPEPATLSLLALGGLALARSRRRRTSASTS